MNNFNKKIAELSPTQRALLEQRLKQKAAGDRSESIPRITNRNSAPLSFSQARMWFLNQLEPGNPAYNRPTNIHLKGLLNIAVLEQSLNEIIRRHEVLRTTFPVVDGKPVGAMSDDKPLCVYAPTLTLTLPIVDISSLCATEREAEAKRIAVQEAQQIFDLSQSPLFKAIILRLSEAEHILLLTMHHIIFDGWSQGILLQELAQIYEAFSMGKPSPLPELPIQYADFAHWQRQQLEGKILESQLKYWKKQLSGSLPVLELPKDRPRGAVQTFQGAKLVSVLPLSLSESLKALSQQEEVTLFMTLLAAFKILLHRYTGQDDILVGSPIAGRNRIETEKLIGVLINTLVLRTHLHGKLSFLELLAQVREVALQAYTHQDIPFEKLVEELHPERNLSHTPLFQVMFQFRNLPKEVVEFSGIQIEEFEFDRGIAQFDLSLDILDTPAGLTCKFEYNTDLFDAVTIKRMSGHFQTLLEGIVTDTAQCIAYLPLLSESERHLILVEWNNTQVDYPQEKCIHQLFEEQVEKTPLSVAVVFDQVQLTYLQLNQIANQLAHHLLSLGVGPEVLVGICVERSVEMVVGLLGILKAGGAYLPLDPAYPQERLSFMLADAQIPILLTQQRLVDKFVEHNTHVICLDRDLEANGTLSSDNPVSNVTSKNLAYIIYTSGSTGKPKGTMIPHRGVVNYLIWCTNAYAVAEGYGAPVQSSIGFDATITSLFSPLLVGQRVVLLPEKEEIEALSALLQSEQNYSLVKITPAHLEMLNQMLPKHEDVTQTRALVIGGEALLGKSLKFWRDHAPNTRIINEYGPTETVVGCCVYEVCEQTTLSGAILIGRPIANTQVYLLDCHLQPVPIGVTGELYVGGAGLAREYLNRPELTAQQFIDNPFVEGERLYKTGDLARYGSDGNIEFIGRLDDQVKIRGFRIELGEIEAGLNTHPQIQQAVVIATVDIPGNKRLIAYVVTHQSLTTNQLREFLKQKLPEYMVPSAFVTLDTLPLTPSGKVDRKALPTFDGEIHREHVKVTPRTPSEEIIANIFAAVLSMQNVGIHDNFFTLGGHSLLATQLISRLRVAFAVEIPLRAVFESPTIAQLDKTITQLRTTERGLTLPPIQPREGDRKQLPLSWAQERLWFLNQLEGSSATYNMPFSFRITGNLDINALQQALLEIVRRHEILRTSFQTVNGTPIQVIHPSATMNILVVDLQQLLGTERETGLQQQAQLEAITPFDLENAPLIRCILLHLSATEYVLLLTMHHIVSDGWSMGVFIQELSALYPAFCAGVSSPLPELPLQYADFAVWQRQWLSDVVLETQLNYWRSQLHGAPELLQLPTDRPRPTVQTYRGRTQSWTLNTDLTQKLQTLSAESGTTLFMTLQAAFATLLYRYSGQSDILIGCPIANRNRSEIESLIGFFVNTLVLRTSFEDEPSMKCLLARVRETTLQAYEHQDVPFEQVVEALQPQRSLSHSPLFQVMFVWQNAPIGKVELPGVTWCQLDLDGSRTIAKFDLTLSMSETDQGLVGLWEYNTDLFDESTIERMAGHFQNLLSAIVENPVAAVGELPLLSEAERHQLLREWNDTASVYPTDKCIHQLFEAQVERTPDAVAVVWENQQLTYRELNTRANQLAHYLQTLGVQPEVIVGICIERSLFMTIALLGILKAGGAYLPLDPAYPSSRLAYMLSDAQVGVLLTQQKLVDSLLSHRVRTICLDSDWHLIEVNSEKNPVSGVTPTNLAYVIYTSGSTGAPKGVTIAHQSVVNLIAAMKVVYGTNSCDSVLQFSSISFDSAVDEIYICLSYGARVVLRSDEMLSSVRAFLQKCQEWQLTVLPLPTTYWHQLTSELATTGDRLPESVRLVSIGGEAVQREKLRLWQEYVQPNWQCHRREKRPLKLINAYGPTEATVEATVCDLSELVLEDIHSQIPIGRPIGNVQAYILDHYLQPVPIGIPGELYLGGVGLARGYLNRPDLTAQKFIPNPFSHEEGARLYKTGDFARYLSNGQIEFVGRIDNQVKIRGFRIELGEIDAVLNTHPQIQQAVVIATEDIPGNKRLVAYVVPSDPSLTTNQVREFLKQKLPEYMIPVAFVFMNVMPLTPNGKVDRGALPAPDTSSFSVNNSFVEPRNSTEEVLAAIWAQVLGLEKIGIHDNFFELGGHSLLGMQLISQASQAIGVGIPLRLLFEKQTIALFATAIEAIADSKQSLKTRAKISPLQRLNSQPENIPLSIGQLWSCYNDHPYITTITATYYIAGSLNVAVLEQSLNEIVRRHDILRTTFAIVDGKPVQVIAPTLTLTVPVIDLRELSGTEKAHKSSQLFESESLRPFDLKCGPLIRTQLLHVGQQEYLLSFFINHIIFDGISLGVFMGELSVLYNAFDKGLPSPLAELPFQFADFVHWQQQYISGEVKEIYDSYWKQKLANAQPIFEPSRELGKLLPAFVHRFELSTNLINSLREMGRKENVSLFIIMLTAFKLLLYTYTGKDDIVVGVLNANRHPYETKFLIGVFANRFLLRTNLSGNPSFRELLVRVRDLYFESYEYQSLPDIQSGIPEIDHAQVFFNFIPIPRNVKYPPILQTKLVNSGALKVTEQDLRLTISDEEDRVHGTLTYTNRLFDAKTIEHLVNLYRQILEQAVEL